MTLRDGVCRLNAASAPEARSLLGRGPRLEPGSREGATRPPPDGKHDRFSNARYAGAGRCSFMGRDKLLLTRHGQRAVRHELLKVPSPQAWSHFRAGANVG
jgi:hypothetical protein